MEKISWKKCWFLKFSYKGGQWGLINIVEFMLRTVVKNCSSQ